MPYVYVIHQTRGPYWETKTVPEVLDTASGGTRDRGHSFSQYGPTMAGE